MDPPPEGAKTKKIISPYVHRSGARYSFETPCAQMNYAAIQIYILDLKIP